MNTRRKFIGRSIAGLTGLTVLPSINMFAADHSSYETSSQNKKLKLRFAIASDGHYGQPGTEYASNYSSLIKWLNDDHKKNHLDFMIMNGDLVHNQPELLTEVKTKYLDKLRMPYHAIPGNHDYADATVWKNVFGYEDNFFFEHNSIPFILQNTADTKGVYTCPSSTFLKAALEKFKDSKIVFVVLHIPPLRWMAGEEIIFLDCPDIVKLLHSYPNVKAVFHGHDHNLDTMRYSGKLPHFFDAHIGGSFGTVYRGYRIFEISENDEIYTYQVNASQSPMVNDTKL